MVTKRSRMVKLDGTIGVLKNDAAYTCITIR